MLSSDTDGGRSRHTGRRGGTTARIARRPRGAGKEAAGSGGATRGRGTRRARYLRDGWEHLINEREQLRRELRRGVRPEGGAGPVRVRQGQPRLHHRWPELPPLHRVPRRRQRRRGEGGPARRLVRDALRRHRNRRRRLLRPRGGAHRDASEAPGRRRGRHAPRAGRRRAGHIHADRRARRERRTGSQIGAQRIHRRGTLRRDVRQGARGPRRTRVGGEATRGGKRRFTSPVQRKRPSLATGRRRGAVSVPSRRVRVPRDAHPRVDRHELGHGLVGAVVGARALLRPVRVRRVLRMGAARGGAEAGAPRGRSGALTGPPNERGGGGRGGGRRRTRRRRGEGRRRRRRRDEQRRRRPARASRSGGGQRGRGSGRGSGRRRGDAAADGTVLKLRGVARSIDRVASFVSFLFFFVHRPRARDRGVGEGGERAGGRDGRRRSRRRRRRAGPARHVVDDAAPRGPGDGVGAADVARPPAARLRRRAGVRDGRRRGAAAVIGEGTRASRVRPGRVVRVGGLVDVSRRESRRARRGPGEIAMAHRVDFFPGHRLDAPLRGRARGSVPGGGARGRGAGESARRDVHVLGRQRGGSGRDAGGRQAGLDPDGGDGVDRGAALSARRGDRVRDVAGHRAGRDDRGGAGVEREVFGRLRRSRDGVFRRGGERRVRLCLHAAGGVLRHGELRGRSGRVRGVSAAVRDVTAPTRSLTSRVSRAFVVTVHIS
mmetsp:Transcript_13572/g.59255  ORF Transcript_13572/g.59255 Transcript_13572/m.59255 type:complete len:717 (+) Transcript_13572:143-2293(+)